jgi:putative glutamine amidotransferase
MSRPRIAIPVPTAFDPDYNARSWPQYAEAVTRAGGEPVPIPLNQPPAETARLIASCSAILLPGSGADVNPQKYGEPLHPEAAPPDPARENVDELLLQDAHNLRKPILTICFGTQMLNVWRGGSLIQHLPEQPVNHRQRNVLDAHPAGIAPHSLLAEVIAPVTPDPTHHSINSSHHQAIDAPGDGLRISARSSLDGIIEAVEGPLGSSPDSPTEPHAPFILGLQWHPERTYDHSPASRAIFARLVAEATAWSPIPPTT